MIRPVLGWTLPPILPSTRSVPPTHGCSDPAKSGDSPVSCRVSFQTVRVALEVPVMTLSRANVLSPVALCTQSMAESAMPTGTPAGMALASSETQRALG